MTSSQDPEPLVSIIIVTYNGQRYLDDCLEAVLDQDEIDNEVIIVDNASEDGGPDYITERFPAVQVHRNRQNRGFAAACNQGAQAARGQVLVFLNQDTRVAPGWLQALVEGLREDKDVGMTTSKVLMMSQPERIHLCGQDVHYTGLVFGRGYFSPAGGWPDPEDVIAISGASFAIRRHLWRALGGFDEAFYMYYEETDLSWRVQMAGYRCRYVSDSIVYHDYRPSQPSFSRLYLSFRNRRIMVMKNLRWGTQVLLAPALAFAELITWGLALRSGWKGARAKLAADLWSIVHLRHIIKSHAQVQRSRKVSDAILLERLTRRLTPQIPKMNGLMRITIALSNAMLASYHSFARFCLSRLSHAQVRGREATT